jgi:hypothetical protein
MITTMRMITSAPNAMIIPIINVLSKSLSLSSVTVEGALAAVDGTAVVAAEAVAVDDIVVAVVVAVVNDVNVIEVDVDVEVDVEVVEIKVVVVVGVEMLQELGME